MNEKVDLEARLLAAERYGNEQRNRADHLQEKLNVFMQGSQELAKFMNHVGTAIENACADIDQRWRT